MSTGTPGQRESKQQDDAEGGGVGGSPLTLIPGHFTQKVALLPLLFSLGLE